MSWQDLERADAELAAFGVARMNGTVSYLATVRKDGGPRVHPVTPIIGQGRLFLFMEPTSPKGFDLKRDSRFALHAAVRDTDGSNGEFMVTGRACLVSDSETRSIATQLAPYEPRERYILFELAVDSASSTTYPKDGAPSRRRWERGAA
ncbi:MAG: pyridoxamine 5'-phosphate oxidase family protein [Chloroflexi bacterium]|nr:pyridoxamine 5'-phosphate oxidase family protein [Chloroflexota bacterium]